VPIDFENQSVDVGGVDDRRGGGGMSGGLAIGGGAGIIGVIIFLLNMFLGGGASTSGLSPVNVGANGTANTESAQQLSDRCNTSGALQQYSDCRIIKVYDIANDVWQAEFQRRNIEFNKPRLAFFSDQTQTGCGAATADVGPFYCPADQEIYFDLNFLDVLQQKFGAAGDYAQAYITAHEYGHHLQTILGIEPQVRQLQNRNPSRANNYSVALELQADCFAGVWANLSQNVPGNSIKLTQQNIAEALNAARAVGDDTIQQKVQGRVDPDGFTHGSAAQRQEWFSNGFSTGDINQCNTFKQYGLSS